MFKFSFDFRAQLSKRRRQHLVESDVYKSQKVCEQLDSEENIETPAEPWFWPKKPRIPSAEDEEQEEEEEEEEECEFDPDEQLQILISYLRQTYFYCLYCGTRFSDAQDLAENCPGETRDDHDE